MRLVNWLAAGSSPQQIFELYSAIAEKCGGNTPNIYKTIPVALKGTHDIFSLQIIALVSAIEKTERIIDSEATEEEEWVWLTKRYIPECYHFEYGNQDVLAAVKLLSLCPIAEHPQILSELRKIIINYQFSIFNY